jgi:hypothetical protein
VTLGGKIIEEGLADFGDFHPQNYRIGTELGQTLKYAHPHSLTITNRLKIALYEKGGNRQKETHFEHSQ